MLTYQVRKRVFVPKGKEPLTFPNQVEIRFHLRPQHAFGASKPPAHRLSQGDIPRHAAIRAAPATMFFDNNTGHHHVTQTKPLDPLDVTIEDAPTRKVTLKGNELTVRENFGDVESLNQTIESIYYAYPLLLSAEFSDPVVIEGVDGSVGGTTFRWELTDYGLTNETTTWEEQASNASRSWFRLEIVTPFPKGRRLAAALHYFHVAARLGRVGHTPWEFIPEILLNFSKILEVLFTPKRDDIRAALRRLDFDDEAIEKHFMPAIALRNEVDVGHAKLAPFKRDDLFVLQRYTEAAEPEFRKLLRRLLVRAHGGIEDTAPYESAEPDQKALGVIEKLKTHYGN